MREYISFDVHKHYTFIEREEIETGNVRHCRVAHSSGAIVSYLKSDPPEKGTAVAVEATRNWYWIINEIEQAGMKPLLVHPYKAKVMMGCINKTDKLDVHGMNRLQRTGTLPTVWIAPAKIRDLRELPRGRMFFTRQRTQLKNRIQAVLAREGLQISGFSDIFGKKARLELDSLVMQLPPLTKDITLDMLEQLDIVCGRIKLLEERINQIVKQTPSMKRLMTLPGIGLILSVVIALEVGDIGRFPSAKRFASYAGCTPRVHASGDKVRYGKLRSDVNRYLKWAFIEAANCVRLHLRHWPIRHVSLLYKRLAHRKGHSKAVGAVARHLSEAAWHVLSRDKDYIEPVLSRRVSTTGA